VWRSRVDNGFNVFYDKESDGSVTVENWTIYWKGVSDFEIVGRAVKRLTEMPPSFESEPTGA
jgi:acetylglutamate synthase